MSTLSFASMMQTANKAPVETSTEVQPLPAGTYRAEAPRFSIRGGLSNNNPKKPDNFWANLDIAFLVNDPKMEDEGLPVREVSINLQSGALQDATIGLGFNDLVLEDGRKIQLGIDFEQNPRFWGMLGPICGFLGLAESRNNGTKYAYPEESEVIACFQTAESYVKAGEAIINNEYPEDPKGNRVENEKLYGLCMAQHQIAALQALLKEYLTKNPLQFEVVLTTSADPRDKSNTPDAEKKQVNNVVNVFLIENEDSKKRLF